MKKRTHRTFRHQINPLNHPKTRQQSPYVTTVKWRSSRDSSVGITTGAGCSLSSPGKGKIFFSSLKRSDRFWVPPSLPCRKHQAPLFPRVTRLADRLSTQLRICRVIPASPTRSHATNFIFHQQ